MLEGDEPLVTLDARRRSTNQSQDFHHFSSSFSRQAPVSSNPRASGHSSPRPHGNTPGASRPMPQRLKAKPNQTAMARHYLQGPSHPATSILTPALAPLPQSESERIPHGQTPRRHPARPPSAHAHSIPVSPSVTSFLNTVVSAFVVLMEQPFRIACPPHTARPTPAKIPLPPHSAHQGNTRPTTVPLPSGHLE